MLNNKENLDRASRRNTKGRRKRGKSLKTAAIIVVAAVVIYLATAIFAGVASNLSTTVALKGQVHESIRVDGYVFRDQTLINAPWDGHFECLVSEGERVSNGQIIGYIYRAQPDAEIMDKIKKLQRNLSIIENFGDSTYIAGGSGVAEKRVSELSRGLSDKRQQRDLSVVLEGKEEINLLMQKKQNQGNDEVGYEAENIKAELASLEQQAGESVKITAPVGGVFSSKVDGFEDKLKYDMVKGLTPSYLKEIDNIENQENAETLAGGPICKIINNYKWCYGAELDADDAERFTVGSNIRMSFYDLAGGYVQGRIDSISEPDGKKCSIVISTNKYVEGIYSANRISADLVAVDFSGIKLPVECLRIKDGVTGVYIISLDVARFVPVNLIYKNDDWAIVTAAEAQNGGHKLKMYDEVIVRCRNLEDGKVVR